MSGAPDRDNHADSPTSPKPRHAKLLAVYVIVAIFFFSMNCLILARLASGFISPFQAIYSLYWLNGVEMPPILILAGIIGLVAWRRGICRKRWFKRCWTWTLALGVFGLTMTVYATRIEPRMLSVEYVTIRTDKLKEPLRILHISDIQTQGVDAYDKRAFDMMRETKPDLIIETGDTIQPNGALEPADVIAGIAPLFASLHPPMGIYHCPGDVDYWTRPMHDRGLGGMKFLFNEEENLTAPDGTPVHLLGLETAESHAPRKSSARVQAWLASHPDGLTLLAGHAPDFVLGNADLPIDLCLAGHTHGGQICIPFFGPICILSDVPRYMARGFHPWGKTRINVCPGIGAEHIAGLPSIRINCPPSMTVIDFVPRKIEASSK